MKRGVNHPRAGVTSVRHRGLTFLRAGWIQLDTQARLRTETPKEGTGRSIPAQRLDTYPFLRLPYKLSPTPLDVGLRGAGDAGRRVSSSSHSMSKTSHTQREPQPPRQPANRPCRARGELP